MTGGGILSIIMDALVIVLLAGTIFYAMRLSRSIKAFQDSRKDMEKLLSDLSSHIGKAEEAIEGLRSNARQAGRDLQVQINEARGLSEELQIMSESGNNLASRLEKLAESSGRSVTRKTPPPPPRARGEDSERVPRIREADSVFAIRDPEFDGGLDGAMDEAGLMQGDYEEDADESGFASQAERDLYEALRSRRKTEAGGV